MPVFFKIIYKFNIDVTEVQADFGVKSDILMLKFISKDILDIKIDFKARKMKTTVPEPTAKADLNTSTVMGGQR